MTTPVRPSADFTRPPWLTWLIVALGFGAVTTTAIVSTTPATSTKAAPASTVASSAAPATVEPTVSTSAARSAPSSCSTGKLTTACAAAYDAHEAAKTAPDKGSCDEEARALCSYLYAPDWTTGALAAGYTVASWKLSLVECLGAKRAADPSSVSLACAASLDGRAELNAALLEACATDRRCYCSTVAPEPGNEPLVSCLGAHR